MYSPWGHYDTRDKSEKDKYTIWSHLYVESKKKPTKHTHKNLIDTDWQLPETGEGGWLKWVKVVKRQISSYFTYSSPEDIM